MILKQGLLLFCGTFSQNGSPFYREMPYEKQGHTIVTIRAVQYLRTPANEVHNQGSNHRAGSQHC